MRCLLVSSLALTLLPLAPAHATTGPSCLFVVNVAYGDALNMRGRPSASSRIVDRLVPGRHGILHLDAPCGPSHLAWSSRWCPVSHYAGEGITQGWVKARYVRDSDCP